MIARYMNSMFVFAILADAIQRARKLCSATLIAIYASFFSFSMLIL